MANIEASVRDWSIEAADAFLSGGTPLNDTIRKIASRESLNREKVARVVEAANQRVFLKTFDVAPDKCFSFKVADVAEVVPPTAAPAGVEMARVTPAPTQKTAGLQKTASQWLQERSENGTPLQVANDVYEKAVLAVELFREKAIIAHDKHVAAATAFAKIAQDMVSMEDYTFEEICETAVAIRPAYAKKIATILKGAAIHMGTNFKLPESVMAAATMKKTAGGPVDPGEHDIVTQMSCGGMPVEVINGGHKLMIALDTLIAQDTEADRANKNLWTVDDNVKYLRREIRNYQASQRIA